MNDFIEIFNPEHLEYFTPDMIIGLFVFILAFNLIGAIIESCIKGLR